MVYAMPSTTGSVGSIEDTAKHWYMGALLMVRRHTDGRMEARWPAKQRRRTRPSWCVCAGEGAHDGHAEQDWPSMFGTPSYDSGEHATSHIPYNQGDEHYASWPKRPVDSEPHFSFKTFV